MSPGMELIGHKIGNYVVTRRLGGGGMGTVYLCEHPMLGRHAALKVLHEDLAIDNDVVDRFFHEAKAACEIGNQHIVDVLDFGRDGNVVYLLMEYLEGESLGARQQRSPLDPADALRVIAQCCEALEASHAKGIVHRDLKPENIFLCRRGNDALFVKIVDFGIAKLLSDPTHQQTAAGIILGTPVYMSPEQCEGKGHVDARADIYSLGVVMFELFTGRVPFIDAGVGEVMVAHMTRPTPRPSMLRPTVPPGIEAIILHAMEKSPARRFQSMRELAEALANPDAHLAGYQLPVAPTLAAQSPTVHKVNTLSGAELVKRPAPAATLWTVSLGAVALVSLVAVVLLAVALGRHPTVVHERQLVTLPAPVVEPPMVSVISDPPGARVERGSTLLGVTPLVVRVEGGDQLRIVLAKPPAPPPPPARKPPPRKKSSPLLMTPAL
jgi:serine/threonine-protein kinase